MDKKIIFVEDKNQTQVFLGECCEIVKNNVFYTANLVATLRDLTHFSPVSHFYTPDVFRGYRNVTLN